MEWLLFIGVLCLIFALYLGWALYAQPMIYHNFYVKQGIPHMKFRFLLGNLPELLGYKKRDKQMDFHVDLLNKHMAEDKKDVYFWWWKNKCRVTPHNHEMIKSVLRTNASSYFKGEEIHQIMGPIIGHKGLLLSEGSHWKRQRKLITPLFHRVKLKAMNETMSDVTAKQLNRWQEKWTTEHKENKQAKTKIEINREMTHLTLDIVSTAIFGSSFCEDPEVADTVYDTFTNLMNIGLERAVSPLSQIPILKWIPTKQTKEINKGGKIIMDLCTNLIRERKSGKSKSVCSGKDLLDLLLEASDEESGYKMSERQLMEECLNFITAGHETTSNLMIFACWVLANRPDIQDRVYEEVEVVMGEDPHPNEEQVKNLKYIEAVLYETLRLWPSAPFIQRVATKDNVIGSGDKKMTIKAGTTVTMNTFAIHRREEYWEDPLKFDPERFYLKTGQKYTKFTYMPFGAGTRQCIGQSFAMQEAKIMLACIIQKFKLSPVEGQSDAVSAVITMSLTHGFLAYIEPRK